MKSISQPEAILACRAAAGDVADFSGLDRAEIDALTVSGAFVRRLLLSQPVSRDIHDAIAAVCPEYRALAPAMDGPIPVSANGVRVRGAIVESAIDLAGCCNANGGPLPPLSLVACTLRGWETKLEDGRPIRTSLDISNAIIGSVTLTHCGLSRLAATGADIRGELNLDSIRPLSAWTPQRYPAFDVAAHRRWARQYHTWAGRRRKAAETGAALDTQMPAPVQVAGSAAHDQWPGATEAHCYVEAAGARVKGKVRLNNACLRRRPDIRNAFFDRSQRDHALDFEGADLGGSLAAHNAEFEGRVNLDRARVRGNVSLRCATVYEPDGDGVSAQKARIEGSLYLCQIAGLNESVATTDQHSEYQKFLDSTFVSFAPIGLDNISIEHSLVLDGAVLLGGIYSLVASRMRAGSVYMTDGFFARGVVGLQQVEVRNDMRIEHARIDGAEGLAILAQDARIGRALLMRGNVIGGEVNLSNTSCDVLIDDDRGMGETNALQLNGFRYRHLSEPDLGGGIAKSRTSLLQREGKFFPQPYVQLAAVLEEQGYSEEARDIRIRKIDEGRDRAHRRLWRDGLWRGAARALLYAGQALFGVMFGYGLKPARAIWTLLVAFVVGWAFIGWLEWRGTLIIDQQPVAGLVRETQIGAQRDSTGIIASAVPCNDAIRPSLYALDLFVPLIDLRQESKCEIGVAAGAGARTLPLFRGVEVFRDGRTVTLWGAEVEVYRYLKALYALLGWILVSLSILTFSGVMNKDRL